MASGVPSKFSVTPCAVSTCRHPTTPTSSAPSRRSARTFTPGYPQFVLEADAVFYVGLPDPVTGACAVGLGPVYRLWNPASNDHWFTADENARDRALAQGYVPEGYGSKGVAWCG